MEMGIITEMPETHMAVRRTVALTWKIYGVISTILKPIIKIGGEKVDKKLQRISAFLATVFTGRFSVCGKKYKIKCSYDVFYIVAV